MSQTFAWDRNHILAKLSKAERIALASHFKEVQLELRQVIHEQGAKIERVYFPLSGMVSILLVTQSGDAIETGVIGRSGIVGGSIISDGDTSFAQHLVQMSGTALTISSVTLEKLCKENKTLRKAILEFEPLVLIQAQQSAACHALHSVAERLCRWLLHSQDIAESPNFYLTQEFLAHMLGVQRGSVSMEANTLQQAGLIKYSRGHVEVLNRTGLEESSCECYRAVRAHMDKLT
jgi:CRP-like cAMP-binding protein